LLPALLAFGGAVASTLPVAPARPFASLAFDACRTRDLEPALGLGATTQLRASTDALLAAIATPPPRCAPCQRRRALRHRELPAAPARHVLCRDMARDIDVDAGGRWSHGHGETSNFAARYTAMSMASSCASRSQSLPCVKSPYSVPAASR